MDTVRQPRRLGIIGCVVGLLALLASALTQLLPAAQLSQPVAGQATEAAAPKKNHMIFSTKRLEIKSREASEPRAAGATWNSVLSMTAASLGVLAIALAVFAVI